VRHLAVRLPALQGELSVIVSPRLRAPREDRAVVAEPPLDAVGAVLADNRSRMSRWDLALFGRPWADLAREARQATLTAAQDYLRRSGEPVPTGDSDSLLLSGHQPELFHPGVWVKNFALHGLARRHGATAVNLVVDNDVAKLTALRVPAPDAVSSDWPHAELIPFDYWSGEVPYEERPVRDEGLFASFGERVLAALGGWGYRPLVADFWPEVLRQAERTPLLGERLAAARRTLERGWDCHNLEVPVSALCQTPAFAWFACHLLANLARFHAVYNDCVHAYRRQYGIRSRNHPVPDLAADGPWRELPLWGWRAGRAQRGRLLARHTDDGIELRVGSEIWPRLPAGEPQTLIATWQDLERQGFKVRSRALTNTLFARLLVSDLFVHGIGGGKYDELTDEIVRRFYGVEPPRFLVLTATLLLPLPSQPVRVEDCRRLRRTLRDLRHNPQRHLAESVAARPEVAELLARQRAWVSRQPAGPRERRERFAELRRLRERLGQYLDGQEQAAARELEACDYRLRANAVLRRRDYAFCLYPERELRQFCTQFL
jgi:hypothetical protein